MAFQPTAFFPGDAFDSALRFAEAVTADLARHADPAARADALARHWRAALDLGWAATLVPEEAGGAGGSLPDLAALLEGAGRCALPLPLAGACAALPRLLRAAGDEALLADAALGRLDACLVWADDAPVHLRDGRVNGAAEAVETPPAPTHHLLAQEDALWLVEAGAADMARFERIDGRLTADLEWRDAPARLLARGEAVRDAIAEARDLGALFTCVEACGAMGALIAETIAYLSQRQQFGATLSSFQALRHRVAEMYVAYENTRGLVAQALREPGAEAIAFAKLRLGEAGRFVAEQAIQVHGGMGMTEELNASRLARRVLMAEFEYGDRAWQASRLSAVPA